jgi:uncharacterized protein YqeY
MSSIIAIFSPKSIQNCINIMSLYQSILDDLKTAMKSKDELRTMVLRSLKAGMLEKEISARTEGKAVSITDEMATEVIVKAAKQRRDSITQYSDAGRDDLANQEKSELEIIESYLPKQLTEAEITAIVDEAIQAAGAQSPADMGKVMGRLMPQMKGKADGGLVNKIVRERLAAL